MYNYTLQLALEDFGIDIDDYNKARICVLESVTNYFINVTEPLYKEQMLISQSILLANKTDRRVTFAN